MIKNYLGKTSNGMNKKIQKNKGMTYVELIVVLSIFSVISAVVMFNYGSFEDKIDIKNLASDVALQIVQAQKSSLSGLLPAQTPTTSPVSAWRPSYGVYFSKGATPDTKGADNKDFIYFTDLNNNGVFDDTYCTGECLNKITITKNNTISSIKVVYLDGTSDNSLSDLTISFSRPNSDAVITSSQIAVPSSSINNVQITVTSPKSATSVITLYRSGRVQIN